MDRRRTGRAVMLATAGGLFVLLVGYAIYRFVDASIAASVEHKSSKNTLATVVSIDKQYDVYQVCYKLDALSGIEPALRRGYESAETLRYTKEGPRCIETNHDAHLAKGDKLRVSYLLENQYRIDVSSVSTAEGKLLTGKTRPVP